jgi:hypothetical protein
MRAETIPSRSRSHNVEVGFLQNGREYMARPEDSTFEGVMPIFNEEKIGAYNWGFVVGKTQTNYHWLSWVDMSPERANPWFHDILNADGTPYDSDETTLIRQLTGTE